MAVQSAKELTVYQKAYQQAMDFFEISKRFPPEERYALTCGYISSEEHSEATELNRKVGRMFGSMIATPEKLLLTPVP